MSSEVLHKGPCPKCGSRDNLVTYTDGHAHCFGFGCGYHTSPTGTPSTSEKRVSADLIAAGEPIALSARKLTEETCAKWGYTVSTLRGQKVQVANYRDMSGHIVAQKVRFPNKDFVFLGDGKDAGLYGQHLWRDGGRRVVITEGEIDALSVSQAQGNKWPVVSLPKGAAGAKKAISASLEWLLGFEEVVLMLDNDEAGQGATTECAALFPPGRCKIAKLPLKDANEMLKAGREKELVGAIFEAKTYRPDGVVTIADMRSRVMEAPTVGFPWFLESLTKLTYGRRLGEVYGIGAGTGVGKTDMLTEQIQYDIGVLNEPVGVFALEQHPVETIKRVAGKAAGKRFHIPDGSWSSEDLTEALDFLEASGRLYLYDNFGATDWEVIKTTMRFLNHSEGVRIFYLDHLTALAAAEDDERTALERIMAEMSMLAKELQAVIIFVSHLSTPDGKPHEEGGRVMIRHFKGSRAIGFWSHFLFGLERDQQADDESVRHTTTFRILKDRYTGQATGHVIYLGYDSTYGRLIEKEEPADGDVATTEASDF